MGYACPVCETPQADGRHLANHLAFTALIHGDDHEAWLDEHAPGWETAGEEALGKQVIGEAAETELPRSIAAEEDEEGEESETTDDPGRNREEEHFATDHRDHHDDETESGDGSDFGDERDVEAVLAEARKLTERMRDSATDEHDDTGDRTE